MPPKKPKQKKGGKKKIETPLDEVDTSVLTRKKLEEFCVNVNEALENEKQYSDVLRLERNKLLNMVAFANRQLISLNNENRMKTIEVEAAEDEHRHIMGEKREKLIHLRCEKNIGCLGTRLRMMGSINQEWKNHDQRMTEIHCDIYELKKKAKQMEENIHETKLELHIEHAENKHILRQKDKEMQMLVENKRDKLLSNKIEELAIKFEDENKALVHRKDRETADMLKNQTAYSLGLKHYYNKIVSNNLTIIMAMKTDMQDLKKSTALSDKMLSELRKKYDELGQDILQSIAMERNLKGKLVSSKKDQHALVTTKKKLEKNKTLGSKMRWELEALNIILDKQNEIKSENSNKQKHLMFTIKTQLDEVLIVMGHMATHLRYRVKELDATMIELRPLLERKGKLRTVPPHEEDTSRDEMNYKLTSIASQRDEIFQTYQQILRKYNIHSDNTGFTPLSTEDLLTEAVYLRALVKDDLKLVNAGKSRVNPTQSANYLR